MKWFPVSCSQTEELLNKRRNLLEKKVAEALEKTKEYQRAKNTRGKLIFTIGVDHDQ